uniref:NR LBD domain-containing protein n=1 Tax=Heterorhabditis bacteriophora TaxID=37862 RepID=A0A1I7X6U2_HETBA
MVSQKAKSSMHLNPPPLKGLNSTLPSSSEFENSTAETPIFTHQQPPILPNFSLNASTGFPMSHHYTNEAFSSSSSNGFKKVQECERALTSSLPIGSGQRYNGSTDDLDRFRSGRGTVNNWNNDSTFPMNAVNVERMSLKKNTIDHRNSYLPSDNSESDGTRGYINRSHPIRNEPSPSNIVIANSRNNQSTQTANILEILEELSREGLIPNKSVCVLFYSIVSPINPSERGARRVCLDLIRDMVWAHRHSTSPITVCDVYEQLCILKFIVNILPSTMAPETVFETNNWHEVIKKELPEVVLWPFNNTVS